MKHNDDNREHLELNLRFGYKTITIAVLELCLILYAVPVLLFVQYAAPSWQTVDILLGLLIPVVCLGGIVGFIINEILEKKLSPERYSALVKMTQAVSLLLHSLGAIAFLWWIGHIMDVF